MGIDRKKTRNILFRVLAAFLILLLIVAYLRYLDLKRKFISAASERATSLIGQRVSIKDLSVSSSAAINLYGVTVENPEGFLPGRLLRESRTLISMHNENKKTVINGMARAIIRINRLPENEQNLRQVLPQAVEQFAAVRRDSAKKGWWIQDPYGNWTRK
jgi:hypothetical protein